MKSLAGIGVEYYGMWLKTMLSDSNTQVLLRHREINQLLHT